MTPDRAGRAKRVYRYSSMDKLEVSFRLEQIIVEYDVDSLLINFATQYIKTIDLTERCVRKALVGQISLSTLPQSFSTSSNGIVFAPDVIIIDKQGLAGFLRTVTLATDEGPILDPTEALVVL